MNALIQHYRCPANLVDLQSTGDLWSQAATDLAGNVESGRERDRLPFELDEVIENLRRERYTASPQHRPPLARRILAQAYYLARPLLGVGFRKHLQRWASRKWQSISFPHWPVDHTVEDILELSLRFAMLARRVESMPFIWFWPDGASAALIMTHDVETAAGRDFCSAVMDLDEQFGIKASFQLVPEQRYECPPALRDEIRQRGHEVNIHDLNHDGRLFSNHSRFQRRAEKINGYAREFGALGFRSAALYRNIDWLQELQFSYDMSVPNVAHLDPQRGGCCTVFPFFAGGMLEIPVTVAQDYAQFHLLGHYSTRLWQKQLRIILAQHGIANFIVHPDYVKEMRALEMYLQLLEMLDAMRCEEKVWIARPDEVDRWWRQRQQMSVLQRDGQWIVAGPHSERASVAYACLQDGRLQYSWSAAASSHTLLERGAKALQ